MEFVRIQKAKAEELDYDPSEGLELGRLRVINSSWCACNQCDI